MKDKIDLVLKKAKKPLLLSEIVSLVGVHNKEELPEIKKILDSYVRDYILINDNGKYIYTYKTKFKFGKFYKYRNGNGKVVVNNSYINKDGAAITKIDEFSIDSGDNFDALDGDMVKIEQYEKNGHGSLGTKIVDIVSSNINSISGEVYREGSSYYVKSFSKKEEMIKVYIGEDGIAGQNVVVDLDEKTGTNFYIGHISYIFDHKDDPDIDIIKEAANHGINFKFSDDVMNEVNFIPQQVLDTERIGRVDLTEQEIFTIDGDDTKDIDDAISLRILPNGNYELGVHIADVSHYVKQGMKLFDEAASRATSAYLAGKVIPMLPHELSNGICSLNPGVDRLAQSCIMEIDKNGNVISRRICKSVIKSNIQMTYNKVNDILDNDVVDKDYVNHVDTLKNMKKLSDILHKKSSKNGALEFNAPELKVVLNDEGELDHIGYRVQGTGENIIENFMVIANSTVDKYLSDKRIPCMHRIHDVPSEERLDDFINKMKLMNINKFNYDSEDYIEDRQLLQQLADYVHSTGNISTMLTSSLIRCMSRAKYSMDNIGHYGLAADYYCHFTSPIRRFPDLCVHTILDNCIFSTENVNTEVNRWSLRGPSLALHSSIKEKEADDAERQCLYMRCAEYMSKHIGEDFDGTIIDVSSNGLHIQLDNYIEGDIKINELDGAYIYNQNSYSFISNDLEAMPYRIGDRLTVKVSDASKENKTINFVVSKRLINDLENKQSYSKKLVSCN